MINMYRSFNFTSIGASHIKKGTVCQDYSASVTTDNYKLAVVSDGHGGSDYFRSDRGSRFAVQAFCQCVADAFTASDNIMQPKLNEESFLKNKSRNFADALDACKTDKQLEERMRWFIRSVVARWNILVESDFTSDPFSEEEMTGVSQKAKDKYKNGERLHSAYGATLIGTVITDNFWFGIHIGDGKCVAFGKDGSDCEPIPWDEQCFLNVTTSICDSNAVSEFRYFFDRDIPVAVFVSSDGIDDCFSKDVHLHNFYRTVLTSFATETEERAVKNLAEYLPELSKQGSADDMSVACIIDIDYIRNNAVLYEKKKLPYLKIFRIGNLGAKSVSDDYIQKKELEIEKGTVRLDAIGCHGFHKGVAKLEIVSAENDTVTILVKEKEYIITPDKPAEIFCKKFVNGICEFDKLIIQCYMK